MEFEELKEKFIKLKKEELEYINRIANESRKRKLKEKEILEAYRKINDYVDEINVLLDKIHGYAIRNIKTIEDKDKIIFDFDIDKDYFKTVEGTTDYADYALKSILVNVDKHKVEVSCYRNEYAPLALQLALNRQYIFSGKIRILGCIYREHDPFSDKYTEIAQYHSIKGGYPDEILKQDMEEYEKDKIIIKAPSRVMHFEVEKIYLEELRNPNNSSINEVVNKTNDRINELSYYRDPNTKEKLLLEKINELYNKVKGEFIKKEILYKGGFLEILEETYKLPNNKVVEKEKVIKNGGKNAVIVIPVISNNENTMVIPKGSTSDGYILTVQNRIKDNMIVEFPSGYIEDGEDVLEAAKRELQEETGYTSDNLFILDEALTSPGTDNSTTYIVVASCCYKKSDIKSDGEELVTYGIFNEQELKYVVDNNIMNGAINKLAYYNFITNVYGSGYIVQDDYMRAKILSKRKKDNPFE